MKLVSKSKSLFLSLLFASGSAADNSVPLTFIDPSSKLSKPDIRFKSVVFPDPEGPTMLYDVEALKSMDKIFKYHLFR